MAVITNRGRVGEGRHTERRGRDWKEGRRERGEEGERESERETETER